MEQNLIELKQVGLPPVYSTAYAGICTAFLNVANLRGHDALAQEIRSALPSPERLAEMADILEYDSKEFRRLVMSCASKKYI